MFDFEGSQALEESKHTRYCRLLLPSFLALVEGRSRNYKSLALDNGYVRTHVATVTKAALGIWCDAIRSGDAMVSSTERYSREGSSLYTQYEPYIIMKVVLIA